MNKTKQPTPMRRAQVVIAEYFPKDNAVTVKRVTAAGIGDVVQTQLGVHIKVKLGYASDGSEMSGVRPGSFAYIDYKGNFMTRGFCYIAGGRANDSEAYTYRQIGGDFAII